ncbi:16486_t:CDS:1 [Acaulospora morrowiae]|uniref:16486_t:CDS:1 n=1 Tax=Acaulospora morrowiae TaxID=94023 RepID=A0A9N9GJF0_9GLOM|nr:16486_t:CDS:1 [Acaulospora morrowiae]
MACNQPQLPFDCILEILKFLQNDYRSLLSCIQINRTWCQLVIPQIWRRPFENLLCREEGAKLIQIYVSLFDDSEIQQLNAANITLPNTPKPLFNYPEFLRELDVDHFQVAVQDWHWMLMSKNQSTIALTPSRNKLVGGLIFSHCNGLCHLNINTINSYLEDVSVWKGAQLALSTLQKLEIQYDSGLEAFHEEKISSLFDFLSSFSRDIRKISINIDIDFMLDGGLSNAGLAFSKLLRSQKHVKILETNEFWDCNSSSIIFNALQVQAKSLTSLKINGITRMDLLFPVLTSCQNLETLSLNGVEDSYYMDINDAYFSPLTSLKLKNLDCWGYFDHHSTLELIMLVLKMTNSNLRTLRIKKVTAPFMDAISQYCPNINNLTLVISSNEYPNLLPLFGSLHSLTHLSLGVVNKKTEQSRHQIYLFTEKIIRSLPSTLEYLAIDFNINIRDWKMFFRNCRLKLKELVLHQRELIQDSYLKVVVDYAKEFESLKVLKYQRPYSWYGGSFSSKALKEAKCFIPTIELAKPFGELVYDA